MPGSRYIRRNRLSRGEQQILKKIGLKVHRELFRKGGTTEIVQGLGYLSVKQFLADIEPDAMS